MLHLRRQTAHLLLAVLGGASTLYACGGDDDSAPPHNSKGGASGSSAAGRAGMHSGGSAGSSTTGGSAGRGGGAGTGNGANGGKGGDASVGGSNSGAGTNNGGENASGNAGVSGAAGEAGAIGQAGPNAGGGGEGGASPKTEICGDGHDNDGDGLVDCADPDCASNVSCTLGCVPPMPYTPLSTSAVSIPSDSLALWLRADVGVGVDGSARACVWEDQSGHAHHLVQATDTSRPAIGATLGGQAALGFTTSATLSRGDVLDIGGNSPRSIFAVFQRSDATDTSRGFVVQQGVPSGGTYLGIDTNTYDTANDSFGCYVTNNAYDTTFITDARSHVHSLVFDNLADDAVALDVTHYSIDGSEQALTRTVGGDGDAVHVEGVAGMNFTTVGQSNLTLAEVIVYGRALVGDDLTSVESYLLGRYGIVPSPH